MNVGYLISRAARNFRERTAIIDVSQNRRLTYGGFNARVNRFANALRALGLKKGDRVAILEKNSFQFLETEFALVKLGLVKVALNAREAVGEHVIKMNNSESIAVVFGPEFGEHLLAYRNDLPTVRVFICTREGCFGSDVLDYETLISTYSEAEPESDVLPEDDFQLRYTGGTTGRPKGVLHTHKSYIDGIISLLVLFKPSRNDVLLQYTPLSHAAGYWTYPYYLAGSAMVIMDHLDKEVLLDTVQLYGVTTMFMVPTVIYSFLEYPDIKQYDLKSIHTIIYGSAPISAERLKEALSVFGPVFLQVYGQSEIAPILTCLHKEDHLAVEDKNRTGILSSAGLPLPHIELKIVKPSGDEAGVGEVGEIVAKGEIAMKEYWKMPEETAMVKRDGWIYTGDMGMMDAYGYVFITDRKQDIIISGGFNIFPSEVEDAVYSYPSVSKCCVIGVPDNKWGESVKAVVVLKPGCSAAEEEIINHCKERIGRFKAPKSVDFRDSLPESALGKIMRRDLKKEYWKGLTRMVH